MATFSKVPAQRPPHPVAAAAAALHIPGVSAAPPTHPMAAAAMAAAAQQGMPMPPPPHLAAALAASAAGNPLMAADYASWLCRPSLPAAAAAAAAAAGLPGYFPLPSNLLAARLGGKKLYLYLIQWIDTSTYKPSVIRPYYQAEFSSDMALYLISTLL